MAFDSSDYELRAKLAQGCRILAMEGHGDVIWGHMTVRDPHNPNQLWMKAAGVGLEEITADDLVLIDFEGKHVAGMRQRHNEFPIHAEIMRKRPEVMSVVHTHPPLATVLGSSGRTIRAVTHEGSYFTPPQVPVYTEMTDLIVTRDQGESVARALGDHKLLFMKNHGIALAATSIEEAALGSMLLTKAAQAQVYAEDLGNVPNSPDDEALLKRQHIYHPESVLRAWAYLVRKLDRWDGMPR